MTLSVSDSTSHRRDQIANLAEMLTGAPTRQNLVRAVYFGKKHAKSVPELAKKLKLTSKRVTEIGKPMVGSMFGQERARVNGQSLTIYVKYDFVQHNLTKILGLANSRAKLGRFHTKTNPKISVKSGLVKVAVAFKPRVRSVSIDDVNEFSKVRKLKVLPPKMVPGRLSEAKVKRGIVKLLGDPIVATDWGGELNDIFTTRVTLAGGRRRAAFALKGSAKKGPLVPKMMGKNGDQILRLFKSPAQVFFVQYEGQIKESVVDQMAHNALAKAVTERDVYYGVIDLVDTYRLRTAYPKAFK